MTPRLGPVEGPLQACPVPHPDNGIDPCVKPIPMGWRPEEGHPGGHMWMSPTVAELFDRGHYDASRVLAGLPFEAHFPENCPPGCEWADL